MKTILKQFIDEPLFDACAGMLSHLHIMFNEVTRIPVSFDSLYPGALTKALQEIMAKVEQTYFIGTVDEASLSGHAMQQDEDDVTQKAIEGKYVGMMIFAVNISDGQTLTRTEMATLTRGFNRIAAAQPVVLFIKQGDRLALSTCERSEYTQQWRDGEKLGKVSMLRDINCQQPHRGHIDILESIGDKAYHNFEELYKHWMQVFSSELLTKKFYGELSDWYAWAVQVARFPNDLSTTEDDEKFNHESCIRLITRLIFVWFLKQKHLIPEEFFDEQYIRNHFIEEFNPHDRENLLYNPEKSRYFRLILQNLFFAMLNRPIVPEGKDTPNNRKFRGDHQFGYKRDGYNVNNLMRYKSEFKEAGADEFLKMANNNVPFLNGGLFDCLDDKPKNLYYDGFSERKESLEQLYLPDWLFFGDEVGRCIDLSQWYGDKKKKSVSARGIIDILKRYNFTIEENTPLDQEVSLDPELLGKAFENLLASYNPETKTSARKQTGSFYTPREIVQYMVDESLLAHLKRTCGEKLEPQYRSLLSYATEETTLTEEQRRNIMQALYNCQVLDPACGSGAFPMGVLQQMVHILRQLDPTNEMWKDFMIDLAIEQSREAYSAKEEERKVRLADIEEAFDRNINDPDYARKLYLIEHCIFGVDIQPIAVQISKLRFFISLVVDQNPTDDAAHNFGIRPLPNLESKFVAANSLIPIKYDGSLVESNDDVIEYKKKLKELNHKIFISKRNIDKQRLKADINETRKSLAEAIENTGYVGHSEAELLADWDMFDQNKYSSYFDADWMFGVKGGFDIVIGNPPYGVSIKGQYRKEVVSFLGNVPDYEIYYYFIQIAELLLKDKGVLSYIIPNTYLFNNFAKNYRTSILTRWSILEILDCTKFKIFESATVLNTINIWKKCSGGEYVGYRNTTSVKNFNSLIEKPRLRMKVSDLLMMNQNWGLAFSLSNEKVSIVNKITNCGKPLSGYFPEISQGLIAYDKYQGQSQDIIKSRAYHYYEYKNGLKKWLWGEDVKRYQVIWNGKEYIDYCDGIANPRQPKFFNGKRMLVREITNPSIYATITSEELYNDPAIIIVKDSNNYPLDVVVAILNSKLATFYHFNHSPKATKGAFPKILVQDIKDFPLLDVSETIKKEIIALVNDIMKKKQNGDDVLSLENKIDRLVYELYGLTDEEIRIVEGTQKK